ncbi:MAG: hypothetical protein GF317_10485 [Candidatus Lokiarchaeota archaeon]|nr:hypothetical protein [Candidatus Lokiarchaeota archaeon]MBD3200087.1 hypothetical protein [Candidatus Lokiarchaeota archaeon]
MKSNYLSLYEKNHVNKHDERLELFQVLSEEYSIKKVLYPGSYVHITPSFVFQEVIYNDMYKKLEAFYDSDEIFEYINHRKEYSEETYFKYINKNYTQSLPIEEESVDLLISQYAGFISRACRRYLKINGILIVNNSHGDASMASISDNYEFIAVIHKRNNKFTHSSKDLEKYFIPKKNIEITEQYLDNHKRGIGYKKTATDYVFRRVG